MNVNPDKPDVRTYVFRLQKRAANGTWVRLQKAYVTDGPTETKSVALPRGVYRAVVPATAGYTDAVSAPVTITSPAVKVSVGRDWAKRKLVVNVNPDSGKGYWRLKGQQRNPNGTWTTKRKSYKTKCAAETRRINLKAGTYRVVVAGKYGFLGSVSAPAGLVK